MSGRQIKKNLRGKKEKKKQLPADLLWIKVVRKKKGGALSIARTTRICERIGRERTKKKREKKGKITAGFFLLRVMKGPSILGRSARCGEKE